MYDYALVHVVYTIPIALILSVALFPLFTRLDLYKITFLLIVAFSYTLPWDSYLVRSGVWTYPPDAIIGPALFAVPAEELFFFIVQTYITTCLYILLNKSTLPAIYLQNEPSLEPARRDLLLRRKRGGQVFFAFAFIVPLFSTGSTEGTYMRLICVWAAPVLLILWTFAYQLIASLPWKKVWLPIALPTLYLWIVDTLALRRGTWAITSGTKLGVELWPHLEIEEAVFFLVTNMLIVFGSCAFDTAVAIVDVFPAKFPDIKGLPSPITLVKALLLPTASYDAERLGGLQKALVILAKKSRSFYLASGVFSGRLRIDLILLYSFCRVADDLIDNAATAEEAQTWITRFSQYLDAAYSQKVDPKRLGKMLEPFPADAQTVLGLLPVDRLPSAPFYSLLDGFRMDLQFLDRKSSKQPPIRTDADLEKYATCVAATIGDLCLNLVYFHDPDAQKPNKEKRDRCILASQKMGRALQYINIVRDVQTDAEVGRCYIPDTWFDQSKDSKSPEQLRASLLEHRQKLLEMAFQLYRENREAIEELPRYARDGIRVAVESYVEIGRIIQERMANGQPLDFSGGGKKGRASVPKSRRVWVGWKSMAGWRGSS